MTLDPSRVQAVFLAALDQETIARRIAVLDCECADDDELRRRVEALLIAHDKPGRPPRPAVGRPERPGAPAVNPLPMIGTRRP